MAELGKAVFAALFLAYANEVIVEAVFSKLWKLLKWDRRWLYYVAIVTGAAASFASNLNIFPEPINPIVGQVFTALAVGAGSPILHDILKKLGVGSNPA